MGQNIRPRHPRTTISSDRPLLEPPIVPEVFAAGGQLVTDDLGQVVAQREEETLPGSIRIGKHVEVEWLSVAGIGTVAEEQQILFFQEGGTRNGNGLVAGTQHRPTVGTALGDEERFSRLQHPHHWQVVDATFQPLRETKPRRWIDIEIPVLDTDQPTIEIEVGDLKPVGLLPVPKRMQSAEAGYPRVDVSLFEEKGLGRRCQIGPFEEPLVTGHIEGGFFGSGTGLRSGGSFREGCPTPPEDYSLTIELDVFDAPFAPLVLAEVEFGSREAAEAFVAPDWFDEDVTYCKEYHNSYMAMQPLPQ